MNIEEAVAKVDSSPRGSALFAKQPFSWGSEAIYVPLDENGHPPEYIKTSGFKYVLEAEEIEYYLGMLANKRVSPRSRAEFIIHYALLDCAPAWIEDIPDTK